MGSWRVTGNTRLQDMAVKSIIVFNSVPSGNKLVGILNRMGMRFASKFNGTVPPTPRRTVYIVTALPLILLHRSACYRCAASNYCPGLVSSQCPQARAAFLPANYKKTFTSKIKNWRAITYTDGNVFQHKYDSPPLGGSGIYKPSRGRDTTQSSQKLQLYINPNGHEPTNTINRAELAGILVALQKGHTDIASDGAACLSDF
eukprot:1156752-Pelagomonas_calceolata.AAC.3